MFSWDAGKAEENLRKHGIDFRDAIGIWEGPTLRRVSKRPGELRYLEFGMIEGVVIAVIWTPRDGGRRVISARRARSDEAEDYNDHAGRPR